MSAQQFVEWQAYAALEPFGAPAAFWPAGLIASTLVNVNRTKKSQAMARPEDFMPRSLVMEADTASPDEIARRVSETFQGLVELQRSQGTHGQ